MKKILILTAGFGDGHNTAAKNISKALEEEALASVSIFDVYLQRAPWLTKILQSGYRLAINKAPMIWSVIFNFLNHPGYLEKTLFMTRPLRVALKKKIEETKPDILVSTYPLYAFLIRDLRQEGESSSNIPFVTVITDSTAINTSWYRSGSDDFIVVDHETAAVLRTTVDPKKIHVLGFPVDPCFSTFSRLNPQPSTPWRILYLPSSQEQHTLNVLHALHALEHLEITVVTGRLDQLYQTLQKSPLFHENKLKLVGWSDQVPQLLASHHLYIGKAGGAIVHEAMAAECPMLISHVVPGQEEGNIELIERHDVGRLAAHYPETIAASVTEIFSNQGATWKRWKKHLKNLADPSASLKIARFLTTGQNP